MARVIGSTRRIRLGGSRSAYIHVAREDRGCGVYIKGYHGLRHPTDAAFFIPKDQLSDLINLLLRAEKTLD